MIDSGAGGLPLAPGESRRIIDEQMFRYLVDLEVVKAQRLQYCISVVCFGPDLAVTEASRLSMPHIFAAMLRRTRATDVITQFTDGSLAVLLIDAETAALAGIVARVRGELAPVISVDSAPVTWSAGAACYPKTATGPADVIRLAGDLLAQARRDGGDRVYIAT